MLTTEFDKLIELKPGEYSELADQTISSHPRLWRTLGHHGYRDHDGRLWVVPDGFYTDYTSSPRFSWWYHPPRYGQGDRAALFHDFHRRCHALLGLSVYETDRMFRPALRDDGIGRRKSWTKMLAVMLQGQLWGAPGDGLHSQNRYNAPVRSGEPLGEWVNRHYMPDGEGFIE